MVIKKPYYAIASNQSRKKIERATITNYELAEEKDYIDITYILASSVPNGNGALFTKEELESEGGSIVHNPLIVVPSWENGQPTGHSIDDFPKLGWDARVIGTHISSETFEEDGITHLKTTARVWKIREPEIAQTLLSLHAAGDLKFSMETKYESAEVNGTVRTLKGIRFIGSAVVDDPANPFSYSLEAASKQRRQKEEKVVTFEEAMKVLKETNADAYLVATKHVEKLEVAAKENETLKGTNEELTKSLETATNTAKELDKKVKEFEKATKEAKEKELASKRLGEMAKYVEYTDEEKEAKMATFASMDDTVFELLLETAKRNKPEDQSGTDIASMSSDTRMNFQSSSNFLDGIEKID